MRRSRVSVSSKTSRHSVTGPGQLLTCLAGCSSGAPRPCQPAARAAAVHVPVAAAPPSTTFHVQLRSLHNFARNCHELRAPAAHGGRRQPRRLGRSRRWRLATRGCRGWLTAGCHDQCNQTILVIGTHMATRVPADFPAAEQSMAARKPNAKTWGVLTVWARH